MLYWCATLLVFLLISGAFVLVLLAGALWCFGRFACAAIVVWLVGFGVDLVGLIWWWCSVQLTV